MSSIHTRLPVILKPADYNRWLDREVIKRPPIDLLRSFESAAMQTSPCNPLVGNIRNNGPTSVFLSGCDSSTVCPDAYSDEIWRIDFEDLLRSILNNDFRDETVGSILELIPGSSVVLASERF
jgi:hypothetical protein